MFLTCCSLMSLEREVELVAHVIVHNPADADPAQRRQGFEPSGDVDAIAEDVAEIDADAKCDAPLDRYIGVAIDHLTLNLNRTGVDFAALHLLAGVLEA